MVLNYMYFGKFGHFQYTLFRGMFKLRKLTPATLGYLFLMSVIVRFHLTRYNYCLLFNH